MGNLINQPLASDLSGGNTGIVGGSFIPKRFKGIIIAAMTDKITPVHCATLTALKAQMNTQIVARNHFLLGGFTAATDSSEAPKETTSGYGDTNFSGDGAYKFVFNYRNGGLPLNNNMRKFNDGFQSGKWGLYFVDLDDTIMGTKDSAGNIRPVKCTAYFAPFKLDTGAESTMFSCHIGMQNPKQLNEKIGFVVFGAEQDNSFTFEEMLELGIIDLELTDVGATLTGKKCTIKVAIAASKANIYDTYSTQLHDAAAWSITDSTGAAVTPSAHAVNAILKAIDLTFTDAGTYNISLASPAALVALTVGGTPSNAYQSNTITVTVTT